MSIEFAIKKLRKFFVKERRLPTYEEMTDLFGLQSTSASFYVVNKLIEASILSKDSKGRLSPNKLFHIPQLGAIQAGHPTPAETISDNSIDLYEYILNLPGQVFSLIVRGDSMVDEGISDGDMVIVEKGREPNNGDVVAAFVDGDWTIKYFQKKNGRITLLPANKKYKPILPTYDLQIGGVVISVIRKYH